MIRSMTGFGRCETVINGREITVEIKSVNHRYFEFSCRTPRSYGFLDDKLKNYVNSRVSRGLFRDKSTLLRNSAKSTIIRMMIQQFHFHAFPMFSRFTKRLRTRIKLLPMFFQLQRLLLMLLLQCVKLRARR